MLVVAAILVLTGLVLVALNARKLISDWPKMKPVHNVDLAWAKIYVGLVLIGVAWFIVADPGKTLREQSTRVVVAPDAR